MNALLTKIKTYFRNAWGRTAAALSAGISGFGTYLLSLQDDLPSWMPHIITLTSAKIAAGVSLFVLSVASFMRHQKAASTIADLKSQVSQQQKPPP